MIDHTFQQLYGEYCWGASWDRQTDLWLQFGSPHLYIREPRSGVSVRSDRVRRLFRYRTVVPRGAWAFAVFAAHWRLTLADALPVTGARGVSEKARRNALNVLNGQRLRCAEVSPVTGLTRLEFDLGAILEIRRTTEAEPDEMWLLYKPNGYVLAVRGAGEFDHRRGTATGEPRWRRIPTS